MGKTFIFFEPGNQVFFETITGTYSKLIEKNYRDVIKTLKKEDAEEESPTHENLLKNYFKDLLFPACDCNDQLKCKRVICGIDKCPVLTGDQTDQVKKTITDTKKNLDNCANSITERIVINKIFNYCTILFNNKNRVKFLSHKHSTSFTLYLNSMEKIGKNKNTEKMVFVSAKSNSKYAKFQKKMASQPIPLIECTYY